MKLLKWTLGSLLILAALSGLATGIVLTLADPQTRSIIVGAFLGPYPDRRDASWHTPGGEELIRASNEHFNIALQISRCFPGVEFAWGDEGPSGRVSIAFMLNMQPNGEQTWGNTNSDDTRPSDKKIDLTNLQRAILTISRSTVTMRSEFAASAAQSRSTMIMYQWLIVIVGAITTILVSIKTIANSSTETKSYLLIGILAVVFSAIGTALASINSFMGPNESYVRSERALLQARQLHLDVGLAVAQEKDLCRGFEPDKPDDVSAKRLTDLTVRLREIIASAGFSGSTKSSTGAATSSTSSSTPGR